MIAMFMCGHDACVDFNIQVDVAWNRLYQLDTSACCLHKTKVCMGSFCIKALLSELVPMRYAKGSIANAISEHPWQVP